jgi:putative NADPH-quinone reductase
MKKLTIIFAHPDPKNSSANKTAVETVLQKYPNASLRNLSELYPDFNIDVEAEQKNLVDADIILLQFPINWYNMPSILKQWIDKVLTYGFAYGTGGDKLAGKTLLISATSGASEEDYSPLGKVHFRLREFFYNIECTAYLCELKFTEPIFSYGNLYIPNVVNTPEAIKAKAKLQAEEVIKAIEKV